MRNPLESFFNPAGFALIGASSNPNKLSHGILKNAQQYGFKGNIYPVNPTNKEILGLPCYADITSVPDPVDLAEIVLPAPYVVDALEACGKRGIKTVIIISGGFKEVGAEGADLEQQCLKIATQYGMRIIGPNCVGAIDLYTGLDTTFIQGMPEKGPIGFVSQSGAVCGAIVDLVCGKGIGFSHFVSLGNEMDVTETDIIEYLGQAPNTKVIACYVEEIKNGPRFIEVCKTITPHKPVVLLKAGQTSAGARAVSSHTGSLAGSLAAYQAAFKQSGVIMVNSASELINVAYALSIQPALCGNRISLITNAGGPAALVSDSLSAAGLQLADLSEATQKMLKENLNPSAQVMNPIDMLGGAEPKDYGLAVKASLSDDQVDGVVTIQVPTSVVNPEEVARSISKAAFNTSKPVISCIMGEYTIGQARTILQNNHIPVFQYPEQIGQVLSALLMTSGNQNIPGVSQKIVPQRSHKGLELLLPDRKNNEMGEAQIRPLLAEFGIQLVNASVSHSESESVSIQKAYNLPVAMKIISPQILHKSDAGGIKLNVQNADEAIAAHREIIENAKRYNSSAVIEGILIEPMAPKGLEVIVGMKRDPQFGPLLMFGLGGIYVELFKDISFRIAPLTREDIRSMITETKAGLLLSGQRGSQPADLEAVIDCIEKISLISLSYPEIIELEINPLLALEPGRGALALDARAILR